jgi:hypothetical protein
MLNTLLKHSTSLVYKTISSNSEILVFFLLEIKTQLVKMPQFSQQESIVLDLMTLVTVLLEFFNSIFM